jgi:hypothetical protein
MQPNTTSTTTPAPLAAFASITTAVRKLVLTSNAPDKDSALAAADRLCSVCDELVDAIERGDGPDALKSVLDARLSTVTAAVRDLQNSSVQAALPEELPDAIWTLNSQFFAAAKAVTGAWQGGVYGGLDPQVLVPSCSIGNPEWPDPNV